MGRIRIRPARLRRTGDPGPLLHRHVDHAPPREPEVRVLLGVGGSSRSVLGGDRSACHVRSPPNGDLPRNARRDPDRASQRPRAAGSGTAEPACSRDRRHRACRRRWELSRFAAADQAGGGTLNIINQLPLNLYVRGSLPGEIPPSWPRETLRAFAIAIRTVAITTNVGGNGYRCTPTRARRNTRACVPRRRRPTRRFK